MSSPTLRTRIQHRLIRALGGTPGPERIPGSTGLVISGGGARSSFELGALQYLYEQERIAPDIITGTSAGAVIAAVIAQYSDPRAQAQAVTQLRSLWLDMEDSSEMFTELPWFTKLNEHMPTWRKVVALRNRSRHRPPRARSLRFGQGPSEDPDADSHGASDSAQEPPDHGLAWSVTNVLDAMNTLWEAGRTSTDLELILSGAQQERAAFRPGPIMQNLTDPHFFDPAAVAASGITLRIATVGLESGELRYVTETGAVHDRQDRPIAGHERVDLVQAVLASCAIPAVFPPVRLGEEHYVDGGARESLPLDVATTRLGAETCYAVAASALGPAATESFASKDMLEVVLRSGFGIMTDEILSDEIRRARQMGATVIEPEVDIHDVLTVDPGLTRIAMDYGWSRAAEECTQASQDMRERTRAVYELRRTLWSAEDLAFRPADSTQTQEDRARTSADTRQMADALQQIGDLKTQLRDLVAAAEPALLPPEAPTWWRSFERHPYPVEARPHWLP